MSYDLSTIKITSDPSFQDEMYDVTPQLKLQFIDLHQKANDKNNQTVIEELIELVIKHPYTPQLKNYLSVAYQIRGMMPKAKEVNDWILAEHPNYLFAILNKVNELIYNQEYGKVEAYLGDGLTLQELYAHRKIFHTTEFTSYTLTSVKYLTAVGRIEEAIIRYNMANDLVSDNADVLRAGMHISDAIELEEAENPQHKIPKSWMQKNWEEQICPVVTKVLPKNNFKIPKFNHPEILMLYRYEADIPINILNKILALPRVTLIQDLDAILDDAEYNYHHYEDGDFDYKQIFFLIHATLILGEIKATESLPKILEILKNDENFIEFYYHDYLLEDIWQTIFILAENQKNLLYDFLISPNISTNGKVVVISALTQFAHHNNEFIPQLNIEFEKIIDEFLDVKNFDSLLDTVFLGFVVAECIDFQFKNLRPKLKELHKRKHVDLSICGEWKDVKNEFDTPISNREKREVSLVEEIYEAVIKDDFGDKPLSIEDLQSIQDSKPKNTFPNANRNENCPCGSGKKYKKCCL